MGRGLREHTIEAFVTGDQYMLRRDALQTAAENASRGRLVHPTLGERWVVCVACSVTEATDERGTARLSLQFVEVAEVEQLPKGKPYTPTVLATAAGAVSAGSAAAFAEAFSISGVLDWVRVDALEALADTVSDLTDTLYGPLSDTISDVAAVAAGVAKLDAALATLISTPGQLATQLQGVLGLFGFPALASLLGGAGDEEPAATGTPSAARARDNREALRRLVATSALAAAGAALAEEDFGSWNEAVSRRDTMLAAAEAELLVATDPALEAALNALVVAVVDDVDTRAAGAPRVRTLTVERITSALELATELYADGTRAEEIAARNDIAHPGFVRAGALEVLTA
jgi:prophage DNA circulation protein